MSGEELKELIQLEGYTIKGAANRLGMSREALYYHFGKEEITDLSLLKKVETILKIVPTKNLYAWGIEKNEFDLNIAMYNSSIPVMPVQAQTGLENGFPDINSINQWDSVVVTGMRRDPENYLAFEVDGDSMNTDNPKFQHLSILDGEIVCCKRIHINSNSVLTNSKIYVLSTIDGLKVVYLDHWMNQKMLAHLKV